MKELRKSGHLGMALENVFNKRRYISLLYCLASGTWGGGGAGYSAEGSTTSKGREEAAPVWCGGMYILRVGIILCNAVRSDVVEYLLNNI